MMGAQGDPAWLMPTADGSSTSARISSSTTDSRWATHFDRDYATAFPQVVEQYYIHRKMITEAASTSPGIRALWYMQFSGGDEPKTDVPAVNSSRSLASSVSEYYSEIESQLELLAQADDPDDAIEPGAVSSASQVVHKLRSNNLAPPSLSWHGGDAVVMLWALGDTTLAITVTDGEVGYVVRRDRKLVRLADSIRVDTFMLPDLR